MARAHTDSKGFIKTTSEISLRHLRLCLTLESGFARSPMLGVQFFLGFVSGLSPMNTGNPFIFVNLSFVIDSNCLTLINFKVQSSQK